MDILNRCYSVSLKTIVIVIIFIISLAFSAGIWAHSISSQLNNIEKTQTSMNEYLKEHVEKSEAVVKRAERISTLVADRCCDKTTAKEIENILYPN